MLQLIFIPSYTLIINVVERVESVNPTKATFSQNEGDLLSLIRLDGNTTLHSPLLCRDAVTRVEVLRVGAYVWRPL